MKEKQKQKLFSQRALWAVGEGLLQQGEGAELRGQHTSPTEDLPFPIQSPSLLLHPLPPL